MKIKGLRWGNDYKGNTPAVVAGSEIAELIVENHDGKIVYVTASVMDYYETISVTDDSVIFLWMNQDDSLVDKLENAMERYDLEINEEFTGEEYQGSSFFSAINFTRFCLEHYRTKGVNQDQAAADAYIAPYIDQDTDDIEVPLATYGRFE